VRFPVVNETAVKSVTELLEVPGEVRSRLKAAKASIGLDRAGARDSRGPRAALDSRVVPRGDDGLESEPTFTGVSNTAGNFT
jgi:hypothetical protein